MLQDEQISQAHGLLDTAQTVVVALKAEPSFDQMMSALGLTQALLASGKDVVLACPSWDKVASDLHDVEGVDLIRGELGNRNLVISFPYLEESVDKVDYDIDEETKQFFLVVRPKRGGKPLSSDSVHFTYSGADADVLILVGIHDWDVLQHLYAGYEQFFANTPTISLHTFETTLGTLKLSFGDVGSFSDGITQLLMELQLGLDAQAATNLLAGIEQATRGLSSLAVTAETFDRVAWLMRFGARRIRRLNTLSQQITASSVGHASSSVAAKEGISKKGQIVVPQSKSKQESIALSNEALAAMGEQEEAEAGIVLEADSEVEVPEELIPQEGNTTSVDSGSFASALHANSGKKSSGVSVEVPKKPKAANGKKLGSLSYQPSATAPRGG